MDPRAADPPEWQEAIAKREQGDDNNENDDETELFGVYPENWQAVMVFVRLRRCWRVDRFAGVYDGLDRPAIESTLKMLGIKKKDRPEILAKLEIMEDAALPILNRKA